MTNKYIGDQVATVRGRPVHIRRVSVSLRSQILAAGRVSPKGEITDLGEFQVMSVLLMCANPDGTPFYAPGDKDELLKEPDRMAEVDQLLSYCTLALSGTGADAAKN